MSTDRRMTAQPKPIGGNMPTRVSPTSIGDWITANRSMLAAVLPKTLTPERFARIALSSIERNPKLRECTLDSLAGCIMRAAAAGLEVDNELGHAYLVPFRDNRTNTSVCTLILGYKGLVTLMHRAGKVSTVEAHIVRVGDTFEYEFGLTPKLIHRPVSEDGDITHSYAIVRFRDGGVQYDVMTRKGIEAIRRRSRAATSGPWVTDYEEMAKKCPLRRISKLVPMSAEEARTVAADEMADAGLGQTFDLPLIAPESAALISGTEGEHTGEAPTVATPDPAVLAPAAAVSFPSGPAEHDSPQKLGASPTKTGMDISGFWAAWRADSDLPQGSKGNSLIQSVTGKPLAGNWHEGLDLAAVLEQCLQLTQKGAQA